MDSRDYLGKVIKIEMDRPLGMKHPKHGFIYLVNYGYVPNTVSGDGEELDAYLLGNEVPEEVKNRIEHLHRVSEHKRVPIPEMTPPKR